MCSEIRIKVTSFPSILYPTVNLGLAPLLKPQTNVDPTAPQPRLPQYSLAYHIMLWLLYYIDTYIHKQISMRAYASQEYSTFTERKWKWKWNWNWNWGAGAIRQNID